MADDFFRMKRANFKYFNFNFKGFKTVFFSPKSENGDFLFFHTVYASHNERRAAADQFGIQN
jgi:hypothetical protein